jgi:hypothetical protein
VRASAVIDEGVSQLNGSPKPTLRLQLEAGVARLAAEGSSAWTTPETTLRLRLRAKDTPWALDIGAQRLPLGTTPLLVENQAMRNELRFQGTIPAGPLRLRLGGRAAEIETAVEQSNYRMQGDAAIVLPIGWCGEVSAQYHRLGFERASAAGYFAPQRVETVESGTYWVLGGNGAVSVDLDLGIGVQRLQKQNEQVGNWKASLRGWGGLNIDLSRRFRFRSEIEAYSAPFAPAGAVTTPNWRWVSVTFGLLVRVLSNSLLCRSEVFLEHKLVIADLVEVSDARSKRIAAPLVEPYRCAVRFLRRCLDQDHAAAALQNILFHVPQKSPSKSVPL